MAEEKKDDVVVLPDVEEMAGDFDFSIDEIETMLADVMWEKVAKGLNTFSGYSLRRFDCPVSFRHRYCTKWLRLCKDPGDWREIWDYFPDGVKESDIVSWEIVSHEVLGKCTKKADYIKLFKECPNSFRDEVIAAASELY